MAFCLSARENADPAAGQYGQNPFCERYFVHYEIRTSRAGVLTLEVYDRFSHNSICFGGKRWGSYLRRKDRPLL